MQYRLLNVRVVSAQKLALLAGDNGGDRGLGVEGVTLGRRRVGGDAGVRRPAGEGLCLENTHKIHAVLVYPFRKVVDCGHRD